MENITTPKERRDSLVLAGMTRDGKIEFVKVYALTKELALTVLDDFFSENELHPSDFVLIHEGYEDVSGKEVISTRTEEELSAMLARLGLKLVSNGLLYLDDVDRLYQITAVSRRFLERMRKLREGTEVEEVVTLNFDHIELPEKYARRLQLLALREDAMVLNAVELDLPSLLRKVVEGRVLIPRFVEKDEVIIRVFDEEIHEVLGSHFDKVVVKPPIVHWDAHVDDVDDFSFKKIEEKIYSAPLFLKASGGFLILTEPPRELVRMLLKIKRRGEIKVRLNNVLMRIPLDFTLVIDTKEPGRYSGLKFPVRINLPPLDEETFSKLLSERLGITVSGDAMKVFPEEFRTFLGVEIIENLWKKLVGRGRKADLELLKEVANIVTGGV
ncbi:hypothetical protein [Pyrococcus yayanosii]|uniref:Uncharacterized protein n=1 Tax=Pyrococcus yayanosii (strain CH1 / JCM 16557) TaxID=529709 RepID=F8AI53_PYRYC|nr:hypothetical protein [Pyrococcus yayanosii]AEH24280.1 hypothetical protein PYCH_05920 [Pyrococcus yayanosii CH1]